MRKTIAALALVPLLIGGATACSSTSTSGGSTTPTTEASAAPTTGGGSAVDTYCENVAAYVAEAKKVMADPQSADTAALQEKAKELATQATELTAELINDPSAAAKVQECTQQLQEAAQ